MTSSRYSDGVTKKDGRRLSEIYDFINSAAFLIVAQLRVAVRTVMTRILETSGAARDPAAQNTSQTT